MWRKGMSFEMVPGIPPKGGKYLKQYAADADPLKALTDGVIKANKQPQPPKVKAKRP